MSESPRITAIRKQDKLNRLVTEKFRVANGKVEKYKASIPAYDIEAAIIAEERQRIANAKPGDYLEGHGIFLCVWEPKDRDGNSLSQKFNVFAAPEDLQEHGERSLHGYDITVRILAKTKNFYGFDGAAYENDIEIYAALRDGSYKGEWIIPPRELLTGTAADGSPGIRESVITHMDNLYSSQQKGSFKDTFTERGARYCSSTEHRTRSGIWTIWFSNAYEAPMGKNEATYCCRPVRLEPV